MNLSVKVGVVHAHRELWYKSVSVCLSVHIFLPLCATRQRNNDTNRLLAVLTKCIVLQLFRVLRTYQISSEQKNAVIGNYNYMKQPRNGSYSDIEALLAGPWRGDTSDNSYYSNF